MIPMANTTVNDNTKENDKYIQGIYNHLCLDFLILSPVGFLTALLAGLLCFLLHGVEEVWRSQVTNPSSHSKQVAHTTQVPQLSEDKLSP